MKKGVFRSSSQRPGLGDMVESLLKKVGITPELVQKVTGKPCGCAERKEKLNEFSKYLGRIVRGN